MKIVIYDDDEQEIASMELFEGEGKPNRREYIGSDIRNGVKTYCYVEFYPIPPGE